MIRYRIVKKLPNGATVSLLQRFVGRRFVEKERAVYTWKIDSEGEDGFSGMHVTETGVCILQPSTDGLSSVAEICMRQTPLMVTTIKSGCALAAEEFHRMLQHKASEDEHERASVVRTALFNGVLSSHVEANV
ncbi:hypothetical protein GN244_ATG06166 [Phytophthora infestans]|uniref:Uncharacterized protein n=1 Tax=Phytophthora infestans TaxID=4787 RepID=A0A833T3B1_PHYIN|nr:hypothetical protein GN244_ATG06166 [Phytophthora infestans]KAF4133667.1 hypothetical protein GN958_ATG17004 [Phytophthora infestans]